MKMNKKNGDGKHGGMQISFHTAAQEKRKQ